MRDHQSEKGRAEPFSLTDSDSYCLLFLPPSVQNNVLNAFLQLENIVVVQYAGTPGMVCPSQEHMNALISSVMIQT